MAIYLGGVVAGLASGWVVLKTTFAGTATERGCGIKVWGLKGPLGAFLAAWGGIAMITSAPFDDWWHNAYGLDTEILSPPHVVLALGIGVIQSTAGVPAAAGRPRLRHRPCDAPRRRGEGLAPVARAGVCLTRDSRNGAPPYAAVAGV
jgi:hypothetical protein